jgi:hypothetical protein
MSPDMIWLLIAQGFAFHLKVNAETLRSRFVEHEGKARITVRRDEFVRGFAGNDWEGVFAEFSEQVSTHVGETAHSRIVQQFSTTGRVETAAFEVTLMDGMQRFFDYSLMTLCGIPAITLEGTPEDWKTIRAGALALAVYDLSWWTDHLLPVLDQFIAASEGHADGKFWQNFYKLDESSGGPYINGHLVNLFPYVYDHTGNSPWSDMRRSSRNPCLGWAEPTRERGVRAPRTAWHPGLRSGQLPPALSAAPFTWEYHGEKLPMDFVAGFIGVAQEKETLALRPEIGWAVRERRTQ